MYGHVNTILPLATSAQRAGHDVVVATGPDLVPHVAAHGVATWAIGPTHAAAGGRAAISPEYFTVTGSQRADDLVPRATAWRPDVVVHEEMELAGAVVAAVTGAHHVVHGLGLLPPRWVWELFTPVVRELVRRAGARASLTRRPRPTCGSARPRWSRQPTSHGRTCAWCARRSARRAPQDRLPPGLDEFVARPR